MGVFSVPVAWDQPQACCEGGCWSAGFRAKGCKIEEYRISFREGSLDAEMLVSINTDRQNSYLRVSDLTIEVESLITRG